MRKEYKRPRLACVVFSTEVLNTGSSYEISGGGPTFDAPDAKASSVFSDEEDFWGNTTKTSW